MVKEMREDHLNFSDFAMDLAVNYRQQITATSLGELEENYLLAAARDSLLKERELVNSDTLDFDQYLANYLRNS